MSTLRIGNLAATPGDPPTAMRDLVAAGGLDVVAVDVLSDEATLAAAERGAPGYEETFVEQVRQCLTSDAVRLGDGGVRVVTNAGALDPAALAARLAELGAEHGRELAVAWLPSGELEPAQVPGLDGERVAVARRGAGGIALALAEGADVVVTGRVSREAFVLGAAAAFHHWGEEDLDALAGGVAVGHVLSGGPGATGVSVSSTDVTRAAGSVGAGYPVAEIAADGTAIITKHPSALGSVTVGTVSDQLLDGVTGARYVSPDVVLRLDSVRLVAEGSDRVRLSGARGEPAPTDLEVVGLSRDPGTRAARRRVGVVARSSDLSAVVLAGGDRVVLPPPPSAPVGDGHVADARPAGIAPGGAVRRSALGAVAGVRQGVVGDGVNLAVWTWDAATFAWLREALTTARLAEVLPDLAGASLERFVLPNLHAVNVVVRPAGTAPPAADLGRRLAAADFDVPSELLEVDV